MPRQAFLDALPNGFLDLDDEPGQEHLARRFQVTVPLLVMRAGLPNVRQKT